MSMVRLAREYSALPRAVHILCLGTLINRAGTFLVVFLTLWLTDELGLTIREATVCMGAYGFGSLGAALIGGQLADVIGRRVVMLCSLFGGALLLVVLSLQTTLSGVLICTILLAFIAEMYRPACSAMIADVVDSERRPHAYGLMYVAINLGFSIAPVVGGTVLQWVSFRWLFWADALTAACYGLVVVLFIDETKPPAIRCGDSQAEKQVSAWDAAAHILRDRTFVILCAATLCVAMVFMQSMSTMPLYLKMQGIDKAGYGRILAINGAMIAFFQLPMTSLIVRFNRGAVIVLATVINAVGFGLIGLVEGAWMYAGTVVVWTCGEMMAAPLMSSVVSDMAPVQLRARYMGVFTTAFSGANTIAAPLGGIAMEWWGGEWLWAAAFVMGMFAALLYASIYGKLSQGSERHELPNGCE